MIFSFHYVYETGENIEMGLANCFNVLLVAGVASVITIFPTTGLKQFTATRAPKQFEHDVPSTFVQLSAVLAWH